MLVSVTQHSVSLHSVPLYTVHGYARVHPSIYIYIYVAPAGLAIGVRVSEKKSVGIDRNQLETCF